MYSLASFSVLSLNNLGASFITITLPFLVSTILDFTFLNLFVENILKVFAIWFSRKLIKLFIVILNFLKLKLLYSRFEFSCIWLGILFNSLPNGEFSNLLIAAAFPDSFFSDKIYSTFYKLPYLLSYHQTLLTLFIFVRLWSFKFS